MNVTPELDAQFRAAAVREGLVDVRYDVVDSPVGDLLVAATDRGLCRISFDPEGQEEELARLFGVRVLRSPLDDVRRELDEYFDGRAPRVRPAARPARRAVPRAGAARAGARPVRASRRPTARSPARSAGRAPRARSARS